MLTRVNNIEMYYEIHGKGDPLIIIPGFGSSSEAYSLFSGHFSKSYQVILFDPRGTGRSSKPSVEYSIESFADDVAELMVKINVQKAHVFGYSMGGMVAQELALNYPDQVKSLILGVTSCGGSYRIQPSKEVKTLVNIIRNPPMDMSVEELRQLRWSITYSQNYLKENKDKIVRKVLSIKYPTPHSSKLRHRQAIQKWQGSYERLQNIRCPSLIIGGEKDFKNPPENSKILAKQIPGAELVIIKNGSHLLREEKEEELITKMLDFLERVNLRKH